MKTPTPHSTDLARRGERNRRVRQHARTLKARVRSHFLQLELAAKRERFPGFTWRGWWYPRWLVLGLLWLAILSLFGLLVVGIFRHPVLGA